MDMSYLRQEFERLLNFFPSFHEPVPPAHRERCDVSLSAAAIFGAAEGPMPLRAPLDDTATLVGPMVGLGDCLGALNPPGVAMWFDPKLPAEDGDIVLVRWHPRTLRGIIRRGFAEAGWLAKYGDRPGPTAVKLLKWGGTEYVLATTSGILPLGDNQILGVLRKREVAGATSANQADGIALGAATDVVSTLVAGPVDVFTTGAAPTLVGSITVGPYPFASTVIVTVVGSVDEHMPSAQFSVFAQVSTIVLSTFGGSAADQIARNADTSSPDAGGSFTREVTYSLAALTTTTYRLYGYCGGSVVAGAFAKLYNTSIKGEVIKR